MRSAEITITGTITIKLSEDAEVKHHHDNKSRQRHTTKVLPDITGRVIKHKVNNDAKYRDNKSNPTTNFSSEEKLPYIKVSPNINEYEAHHPDPRDERFFVDYGKEHNAVTAHELIVRDGKMLAIDESTLKGVEGNSAGTTYGTIVPNGNGDLKLFSNQHGRWFKCTVVNGVYSIKNLISDARKYDL